MREIKERTLRDVEQSSYILYRTKNNSENIRWAGFYVETKSEQGSEARTTYRSESEQRIEARTKYRSANKIMIDLKNYNSVSMS